MCSDLLHSEVEYVLRQFQKYRNSHLLLRQKSKAGRRYNVMAVDIKIKSLMKCATA